MEPAELRVTVVAVVARGTDWSGPALATTEPCGVSGPTLADGSLVPLALVAATVKNSGTSPGSPVSVTWRAAVSPGVVVRGAPTVAPAASNAWIVKLVIDGSGAVRLSVTEPGPTLELATTGAAGVGVLVIV